MNSQSLAFPLPLLFTQVRVHQRKHTVTGAKPYHCTFCPYRSTQSGNVRVHERTHTGERPYACPLCPYAAASSSKTVQHIRSVHPEAPPGTHPALPTRPGRRARGGGAAAAPTLSQA